MTEKLRQLVHFMTLLPLKYCVRRRQHSFVVFNTASTTIASNFVCCYSTSDVAVSTGKPRTSL